MTTYNIGLNTGNTGSVTATTIDKSTPAVVTRASGMNVGCTAGFANIARMVFDVSFGSLSGAGTVTGAILKIANADAVSPAATYELRSFINAFTFAQVTWNSRLTSTAWNVAGALTGTDVNGTVIASGSAPTAGGDTLFNITGAGLDAWVQGCIDGSITNKQLILSKIDDTTVAESARRRFRTDQAVSGIRPLLTFDFTPTTLPNATISDPVVSRISGTATFTVTLSSTYASDASVSFATADGTATAGVRYTTTTATVTIPAGQTTGTVTVPILP